MKSRKFKSTLKQIVSSRAGTIKFTRGTIETSDPKKIAVLSSHPAVSEVQKRK
jgi:hypothetical protein